MSTELIPANLRQWVEEGIQTGVALNRIDELSPLQRLLYQDTDFHFAGNALLRKREASAGSDRNESDPEVRAIFAESILDQIEQSGKTIKEIVDEKIKLLGVNVTQISQEDMNEKYKQILFFNHLYSPVCEAIDSTLTDLLDIEKELSGATDEDAMNHVVASIDQNGKMLITTSDNYEISVDVTSMNTQFSGVGHVAPKDSYQTVRLLNYEVPQEHTQAAEQRRQSFKKLIKEIKDLNPKHIAEHRRQLTASLYAQDKEWRATWGTVAMQKEQNRIIDALIIKQPAKDVVMYEDSYTLVHDRRIYKARVPKGQFPSPEYWRDNENIKVSMVLGQQLATLCTTQEQMPEVLSWTLHCPAGPDPRPNTNEEVLRQRTFRKLIPWLQEKKQATTELNFTMGQWNQIYEAYGQIAQSKKNVPKLNVPSTTAQLEKFNKQISQCTSKEELTNVYHNMQSLADKGSLTVTAFLKLKKVAISHIQCLENN